MVRVQRNARGITQVRVHRDKRYNRQAISWESPRWSHLKRLGDQPGTHGKMRVAACCVLKGTQKVTDRKCVGDTIILHRESRENPQGTYGVVYSWIQGTAQVTHGVTGGTHRDIYNECKENLKGKHQNRAGEHAKSWKLNTRQIHSREYWAKVTSVFMSTTESK